MRLPWLQVNEDGFTRARSLAALLGVTENEALGLVLRLWRWALEMAPAGDFSGTVPDAELLAASVGWPREKVSVLLVELQRVGLVATTPSLRVRGLDRYHRAWEKNQRKPSDSGCRVPESGANPALTRQMSARKTETETKKDTETEAKEGAPASRAPRKEDALVAVYLEATGKPYLWSGAKDGKAFARLRAARPLEEICDAWRWSLRQPADKWHHAATVAQLASKWSDVETARAKAQPARGEIRAVEGWP